MTALGSRMGHRLNTVVTLFLGGLLIFIEWVELL